MARTEIGNYRVQGMDYAYNLQGWIKGVNAGFLDANRDMGQDGKAGGTLSQRGIARDAYGYTLGYFEGDYLPIGGASINFELNYSGSTFNDNAASLYNGNIRHIVSHNKQLSSTKGQTYKYDQLHRLKAARMWDYTDSGSYSWTGTGTGSNKYYTFYQYDPNGNLTNLLRYNEAPALIDNLGYVYYDGTNRLSRVGDGHSGTAGVPSGQPTDNYQYDENGNLVIDLQNDHDISWTWFGKVRDIKDAIGTRQINFGYGPDQNRWTKSVQSPNDNAFTFYTRDAQGNILATYESRGYPADPDSFLLIWKDCYIYGSSRIANLQPDVSYRGFVAYPHLIDLPDSPIFAEDSVTLSTGWKRYEIANHLGNITATVSDRKRPVDTNADEIADYYNPTILSATDYYPFGMDMPNRTFNAGDYRFGFNGKEADRNGEWGNLNHYDYGFRIYNPGIAKFLSVDPLRREYAELTPYQFASNTPIAAIDLDGLEMLLIGNRKFMAQQEALIKGLAMTKFGRKQLNQLANSGRILVVKDSDDIDNYIRGQKVVGVQKEGTFGTDLVRNDIFYVDDDFGLNMTDGPGNTEKKIDDSPVGAFGHEIQHFLDPASTVQIGYAFETYHEEINNFQPSYHVSGFGNSEINGVHVENIIRTELGFDLRNYYAGLKITDVILDRTKKIRSIFDIETQQYTDSPYKISGLKSTKSKYDYSQHSGELDFKAFIKFMTSIQAIGVDASKYSKPNNKTQQDGVLLFFPKE